MDTNTSGKEANPMMELTLKDLEIRYANLRDSYPKIKQCSVSGCDNPKDVTDLLGMDTSCAYHRLLFDHWIMEVVQPNYLHHYLKSQKGRRRAFTNWRNRIGKKTCDQIVLRMAGDSINWKC